MSPWERRVGQAFAALRLDSIKDKIVALAVLATLLPTLATAIVTYTQNTSDLTEQLDEELQGLGFQTAQEMNTWIEERLDDVGVLGSSYEVTENLESLAAEGPGRIQAASRLRDYLTAVVDRFPDYSELMVLDDRGAFVASSDPRTSSFEAPVDWGVGPGVTGDVSDPFFDEQAGSVVSYISRSVRAPSATDPVGTLIVKVDLERIIQVLRDHTPGASGRVRLLLADGTIAVSSERMAGDEGHEVPPAALRALSSDTVGIVSYVDASGQDVLGILQAVTNRGWSVLVELPRAEAYAPVLRLRNLTILVVFLLLGVIGIIAYFLGQAIVSPLARLTAGAAEVAAGDLTVDLPVAGGGEVGYLTQVFNDMVKRLQDGRRALDAAHAELLERNKELERLSVTDALTDLTNRRRAMEVLAEEILRSDRQDLPMSLLMLDVDHFKQYNDTHGHLEGDMVLRGVAKAIRQATRGVDTASRFGGEEFMILLPECDADGAMEASRRILERLASQTFKGGPVTMSIGAAVYPLHADEGQSLIGAADLALYQAKREGRNQAVLATVDRGEIPVKGDEGEAEEAAEAASPPA